MLAGMKEHKILSLKNISKCNWVHEGGICLVKYNISRVWVLESKGEILVA